MATQTQTALSYEQLVAQATAKAQALATYYLTNIKADDFTAYTDRNGRKVPAHSRYTIQVWDTRTANFSQPCGLFAAQAHGDTPAEALAALERELSELEYQADPCRYIDAQVESYQELEAAA